MVVIGNSHLLMSKHVGFIANKISVWLNMGRVIYSSCKRHLLKTEDVPGQGVASDDTDRSPPCSSSHSREGNSEQTVNKQENQ